MSQCTTGEPQRNSFGRNELDFVTGKDPHYTKSEMRAGPDHL